MIKESDSMAQNLVIYVQGGQVRRATADFEAGINCLIVYADVPAADQGQPWVREIEWPAGERREVLIEGIAVEHSPDEVQAVIQASEASRARVRELLRDADSPGSEVADHDEDTSRVKVYRWQPDDANGGQDRALTGFGTLEAIAGLDRCVPILETEAEVDPRQVDANGFLMKNG